MTEYGALSHTGDIHFPEMMIPVTATFGIVRLVVINIDNSQSLNVGIPTLLGLGISDIGKRTPCNRTHIGLVPVQISYPVL